MLLCLSLQVACTLNYAAYENLQGPQRKQATDITNEKKPKSPGTKY